MATKSAVNILVVDDSPSKLLAMSAALADLGQNVVAASSGREALRYLLDKEFAVIILDVNMPDIDGFDTAELIRQHPSSARVPIIFVTAFGDDTHAARGYSLGAVDYLLTPVIPEVLRAKVTVFVDLHRRNLEERAQAEQQLVLAREQMARRTAEAANRMKDEFLATLSHELRTPLNSILGWVQILRMGKPSEDDIHQAIDVIERSARMQAKIIEDLLDVSRIISGKLQLEIHPAHLTQTVEAAIDAIQLSADAKQLTITRKHELGALLVRVDARRLQQCVWNLLSNAVKFTPPGGTIEVVTQRCDGELQISVTDSGEGIAADFLPFVFERFRQADASTSRANGGLGIGLALVRELVELHAGRVSVESGGAGLGSTFRIHLPLSVVNDDSSVVDAPSRPIAVDDAELLGVRVLVVDDEPDARRWVARVLAQCHAEVVEAGSADAACESFRTFKPQIVVSDIGMPGRDGYDLVRELRSYSFGKDVPAIALTAYARSQERSKALSAGFQQHLAKPVSAEELVRCIQQVLRSASAGQAMPRPLVPRKSATP